MMLIVLVAAIDFAALRGCLSLSFDPGIVFVALPMANLLILVAPRPWSRGGNRSFWIGFEAVGWPLLTIFGCLAHYRGARFFWLVNSFYPWPWGRFASRMEFFAYQLAVDFLVYTPPLILLAWSGGRLTDRLWANHTRRKGQGPNDQP